LNAALAARVYVEKKLRKTDLGNPYLHSSFIHCESGTVERAQTAADLKKEPKENPGNEAARDEITAQSELSKRALEIKQSGEAPPAHPEPEDTPNDGIIPTTRPDHPPSGAFDAEGHRPVLERSRKVR